MKFRSRRAIKDIPVVTADNYLNKLLVTYCEEALARRVTRRGSLRASVENAIVPLLPHGDAKLPAIARQLGISPRTLARQLAEDSLNFSDVLENLKVISPCVILPTKTCRYLKSPGCLAIRRSAP